MDWNRLERQVLSGTRLLALVAVVSFFAGALPVRLSSVLL